MRFPAFPFFFFLLCHTVFAQTPSIKIIDFYGLRTITKEKARAALQIKEGDPAPKSKAEIKAIEKRLAALPNVSEARVSLVCCADADGGAMLYAGLLEKGGETLKFRAAPQGAVRLPAEIVKDGEGFYEALTQALQTGDAAEDVSQGHSLVKNEKARAFQEKFALFAARNQELLKKVLRESADARHRALAAQVIAYARDKSRIVSDLVYAMRDADESVRNNAIRALAVLARYAQDAPKMKIKVPVEPFVDLLNSVEWSDRNKSSLALLSLTAGRDPKLISALRRKALASLIEMARWQYAGHADSPFFILGRVLGFSETEIESSRSGGKRGELLKKAEASFE